MKWRRNKHKSRHRLEEQRAEKLAELGSCLRQVRLKQSISLEEVTAKTWIQRRQLQAIEEAQLDELPEPVYIKSFIKKYADALGLNGAELSSAFPTDSSWLSIKPSWRSLLGAQLRPIHLYLLYVFVIICAVSSLSNILSRSELQANGSQIQQPAVHPVSKRDQILTQSESGFVSTAPSDAIKITKPVRIGVTLKAQSWIRVVADGKTQFEGVLPKGTQRTWVAQQQLTVLAGNAGGVLVSVNQEKARLIGKLGEVQEVTFAANQKS